MQTRLEQEVLNWSDSLYSAPEVALTIILTQRLDFGNRGVIESEITKPRIFQSLLNSLPKK